MKKSAMKTKVFELSGRLLLEKTVMAIFLFAIFQTLASTANAVTNDELFVYQIESRPDPFQPFITEKSASSGVDMNEIMDDNEPLTGMQLFEPGQLTLVAVMKSGNEDIAMVEDFTGKGYVLTEGIKIGRRGVIQDIGSNSVIIEETAWTRAGKKIVTKKVMTLKKDEGEN